MKADVTVPVKNIDQLADTVYRRVWKGEWSKARLAAQLADIYREAYLQSRVDFLSQVFEERKRYANEVAASSDPSSGVGGESSSGEPSGGQGPDAIDADSGTTGTGDVQSPSDKPLRG